MLLDKYCAEMRIKIRGNYALLPPIQTEEIQGVPRKMTVCRTT